ncbi:MAG: TetR/AcrR family transcriptional regulator [Propionibacteriaceae bacterium]|jgi:AcrR family transcriptional regulator|nr:TetR/AcrR family transcriptional regulator [Propionibacteriaceae bacterium]
MAVQTRRVRYTLKAIRDSFLELLAERPLGKVTVSAVCARADVARGTFYLHYSGLGELLDEIEEDLIAEFEKRLRVKGEAASRTEHWEAVLSALREQQATWAIVLAAPESKVIAKCLALTRAYTERDCQQNHSDLAPDLVGYLQTFLEQGSAHVVTRWLQDGCSTKIKPLAGLLAQPF